MAFTACDHRAEQGSKTKDVTSTTGAFDSTGLWIPVSPERLKKLSKLTIKAGSVNIYSGDKGGSTADPNYKRNIDSIEAALWVIPSKDPKRYFNLQQTTLQVSENEIKIRGALGLDSISLPLQQKKQGKPFVRHSELSEIISVCPTDLSKNTHFHEHIKKKLPDSTLTMEPEKYDPDAFISYKPFTISEIFVTKSSLKLGLVCNYHANFKEHPNKKGFRIKFSSKVELAFDADIFEVNPDDSFSGMRVKDHQTEIKKDKGDYGTRYFPIDAIDFSSPEAPKFVRSIQKWNLTKGIVIDDVLDLDGKKLADHEYGTLYVHGIRRAVASLKESFPKLGDRISLKTQSPEREVNLALRISRDQTTTGLANMLVEDSTGEILQAAVNIDGAKLRKSQNKMKLLKEVGLSLDSEQDFALLVDYLVMHEIGHALGLRHNFEGFSNDASGKPRVDALMSYPFFALPPSLFSIDKMDYRDHDILSLKYLYSDSFEEPEAKRSEILKSLFDYRLSKDDMVGFPSFNSQVHLQRTFTLLEESSHDLIVGFRKNPEWREKIKVILETPAPE